MAITKVKPSDYDFYFSNEIYFFISVPLFLTFAASFCVVKNNSSNFPQNSHYYLNKTQKNEHIIGAIMAVC